jgi:putrescine aminotransferase
MDIRHSNRSDSELDLEFHLHSMTNPVATKRTGMSFVESAKGVYVTIDGRRYQDGWSGLGCSNIGYGNEAVCDAASEAMRTLSFYHSINGVTNHNAKRLAAKLSALSNGDFTKFFFVSTGSDAMETAIKIAWRYWILKDQPKKRMLIARQYGYHGNTIVACSISGIGIFHEQFGLPLPGLVRHVDAPYHYRHGEGLSPEAFGKQAAASLENAILEIGPENVAAFVAEPVQTSYGMVVPPPGYFEEIQRICKKYGVLMIADEIVTGFGKMGTWFGYQNFNYTPDLIALAKGLTSAYFPMSACGMSDEIAGVICAADVEFAHGFTNCANPVGSAVALANIGVIENNGLLAHVRDVIAPKLAAGLGALAHFPVVGQVRSCGVFGAVDCYRPGRTDEESSALAQAIFEAAQERGLLLRVTGLSITTVFPMITTAEQLEAALAILHEAVEEVSAKAA